MTLGQFIVSIIGGIVVFVVGFAAGFGACGLFY